MAVLILLTSFLMLIQSARLPVPRTLPQQFMLTEREYVELLCSLVEFYDNPPPTSEEDPPVPSWMQFRKIQLNADRTVAHMSTAEVAKLSENVAEDYPGAVVSGHWKSGFLKFTFINSHDQDLFGAYQCVVGYTVDPADLDVGFWKRTLNVTDTGYPTHMVSHPSGFEVTIGAHLCVHCPPGRECNITSFEVSSETDNSNISFTDGQHTIIEAVDDSGVTMVCIEAAHKLSKNSVSLKLNSTSGAEHEYLCSYVEAEKIWNCTLQQPSVEPSAPEHGGIIIVCVFVAILLVCLVRCCYSCLRNWFQAACQDHAGVAGSEHNASDSAKSSMLDDSVSTKSKSDEEEEQNQGEDAESDKCCSIQKHSEWFNFQPRLGKRICEPCFACSADLFEMMSYKGGDCTIDMATASRDA